LPTAPAGRWAIIHHTHPLKHKGTHKAQLQQTTQELGAKISQMKALESRVRASLKGKYGAQNEKLAEFGIKPLRRRAVTKPAA
jgi:isopentenyldiphosphate isomerase